MNWLKFDFFTIIMITGIAQGIFLSSALLTTKRGERLVNRMLVCLISIFSLDILFSIIFTSQLLQLTDSFVRIDQCIKLLYGPVLFFFMKILCSHSFYFKKIDMIHFIPFLFSFLFLLPISLISPHFIFNKFTAFIAYILPHSGAFLKGINFKAFIDLMKILISTSVFIHIMSYLVYCYRKMVKYRNKVIIFNKKEFKMYKILIFTCLIYNVLSLSSSLIRILIAEINIFTHVPPLFITSIIYITGYMSILKPGFLFIKWEKEDNHSVYKKINLSEQQLKEYLNRLFSVMKKEKLYKDQDLTLSLLAERIHLSRNLLSYLLNNVIGINFYDFINGFRVEAVKDLLIDTSLENENILNIAFHAGFNSKSAFNKIFKKHTNMSPSQYRKVSNNKRKEKKLYSHLMELNMN